MSIEVVETSDGRYYLIVGTPGDGYDVLDVNMESVARFARKYDARHAIRHDQLEAPS